MARLIDRRVAIEAIKEIRDKIWDVDIPSPTVPEYIEHHQQMIHLMNECDNKLHELYLLPSAQPEQRWIPCSERLPKENGHYLVTFHQTATEEDLGFDMDDTDVRKMRYDTKHGWRTPRHIPSWINDAVVSTVLAWMPLPEPYKAIDAMHSLPSAQPEQRYTEEELRVFAHGISLSLLSKRSAQHWRYDKDTATEIEFLERLYDKVSADMKGGQG